MRITPQTQGDRPLSVDLDTGFVGVNDRVDPALLRSGNISYADGQGAAGLVAAATNNRFIAGLAQTRPATVMPPQWQATEIDDHVRGAGVYSDPDGSEWIVVALNDKLLLVRDNAQPQRLAVTGLTAADDDVTSMEFCQAFGNLVVFRGFDHEPLFWDGDPGQPLFKVSQPPVDRTDPDRPRYLSPVPAAEFGIVTGDRLWVVTGKDTLEWSDLLDYNAFDRALNATRINSGEDDAIVALLSWEGSIIIWKDQSIFRLEGTTGDLSGLALERLNRGIGCLARRSVAQVGSEVFWLAQGGVYRLSQAFESRLMANPVPVSDSIDRTMRRINWTFAHEACGIVVDRYYYLAVPLDQSRVNNAVLVLDVITGQWQGVDTFNEGMDCRRLLRTDYLGRRVPVMMDLRSAWALAESRNRGRLLALDQPGRYDRRMQNGSSTVQNPIAWSLTTRGYALGEHGIKKLRAVSAAWSQQGGESRISMFGEGPGETRTLSDWRTYDRTKSTRHGATAPDITNAAGGFSAPWREDYSLVCGDSTRLTTALPLSAEQHFFQGWPVRREARWLAFTFENRAGAFTLKSVSADGLPEGNILTRRN